MNTKLYIGFLATSLLAVSALQGCSDDTGTGTGGSDTTSTSTVTSGGGSEPTSTSSSTGTGGTTANPAAPVLGPQIDRFGRPAINTALNHTFEPDQPTADKAKDAYNQDADPTKWTANVAEFSKNLAILDSLDTVCGNQLLAAMPLDAKRYNTLSGALANDRIFLDTSAATSTTYLAVEANATGLLPNMDGGGRKLSYDVIDASYSALAAGSLMPVVNDGVTADADTKGEIFPYLAAPH